ncbi:hypothetical protein R5R35_005665 [Gryllus longicercus]|uniref:C2H2-type domain-containing protein n=1 Tax=Gryllus longicercus TaxID=2509291 RepID=A0AAN9Z4Q4_9ORTH
MNEERTPHQIVFSELKCGKRPQQKPKKRWLDMLKQDMREQNINEKEWRKVAANRNEWRRHIQQKTVERQEMQNLEAEERRQKRQDEEEMHSWKCPMCGFTREGRSGRQYVNSHLSQAHRSQVEKLRQRQENSSPRCTVCNINFKKKSGHSSHMRHKHPTLTAENTLKPIKLRKPQSSSHSANPTQISQPQLSGQSSSGYPFNCASCGRNFKTKAGLSNHRRGALCKNRMEEEVSSATMET